MKKVIHGSLATFILISFVLLGFSIFMLSGCDRAIKSVVTTTATTTKVAPERISLYWENTTEPHPERKPWSEHLVSILESDIALYSSAKDIRDVCPGWDGLGQGQKIKALGEFWVAMAYYESGFNPKANSVDVGTSGDKGSWSVGLYQMSANDGAAKKYNATFESLKDPLINISVATEQMRRQLKNTNEIFLPNSSKYRYWAVALKNNKFNKIPEIKMRVLKHAPGCH